MIFPTSHEDLRSRRWPWVTTIIVVLNLIFFLGTYSSLTGESEELGSVKLHILILSALYPNVDTPPEIQEFVDGFKKSNPRTFEQMKSFNRPVVDAWEAQLRMRGDEGFDANAEMADLAAQYKRLKSTSSLDKYAFYPNAPSLTTYVTANFLHGGWLHLIFNMWFLWLAGAVLEDKWGRPMYIGFYLVAGAFALWVHKFMHPGSVIPVIGASGAVSALMGAFLVPFFKTKIDFVLIYFLGFVPRFVKFKSPAYLMLPLWFVTQLFWGAMTRGEGGGVAYWAHIGGFAFGLAMALGLRFSGVEKKLDEAVDATVSWSADPGVVKAHEFLERQQPDEAVAELQRTLQTKPDLVDAHQLLAQIYWRQQNLEGYRESFARVIQFQIKAKEYDAAIESLGEFRNAGGEKIPAAEWVQLCRALESKQDWEGAAAEYEAFARAYPADKLSVYALVSSARICLKQLNRPEEAAARYKAAAESPVPHLDWDDAIRRGLQEAASVTATPVNV
jgi:membrane associated rhomboid family serine protease